jgi:molecular chaperone GrpE
MPKKAQHKEIPVPPDEGADTLTPVDEQAVLQAAAEGLAAAEVAPAVEQGTPAGGALAEPLEQALVRLERELAEWKDRALRSAADLENYRKRAVREREEAFARAPAEVLSRVVEVVDDLARVAHLDPDATASAALHEGMLQIERKFQKVLEASGVERVDPVGAPFDPQVHEAVMTMPAPSAAADHTVGMVFQYGYRFRGALLRPARVAVLTWTPPAVNGEIPPS